jgi:hypothetical protein
MIFSKTIGIIFIILAFITLGCVDNAKQNSIHEDASDITAKEEFKIGGLYISKKKDSAYSVCKIIVLDDFAVHLRAYKDKFTEKPKQLNSANLHVSIGHFPIDRKGFLLEHPELITVEEVKDAELEGYKIYLEQMNQ